jgi:TRAP-type C4-dicarboxylate transport system permease small subunit
MELFIHFLVTIFGAVMAYNCAVLAESVWNYSIPTLGISEAFKYAPPAMAGGLIVLFSIEHIIALINNKEVEPSWH